ncbi:MAG: MarR family transcriptional regulator, partial [Deltaproteobacteria bacterium]
ADTRGRQEGRPYPRSQQVIHEISGLGRLLKLYERDGRSQGELADKRFCEHPNIIRMLDALEKQQFVTRATDPNDRRRSLVHLTTEGRNLVDKLLPELVEIRIRNFKGVEKEDYEYLTDTLRKLEENLLEQLSSFCP